METGKTFWKSASGRWAAERMLKAMKEGREISSAELRTNDTLRKDEWKHLDDALIEETMIRLTGVADLLAAGLSIPIPNAIGKTIFQWEDIGDMEAAQLSMDGAVESEQDKVEYTLSSLPLPIMHKDFYLNLRTLAASRERGEALDTTQVRYCGRLIAEETEKLLFQGTTAKFGGSSIYGYMTHPDRNLDSYGTNAWSNAATTGENMLADVLSMIALMETQKMWGPYWLYVPRTSSVNLEKDFKAASDKSIRQRLLEVDSLAGIRTADQLTADNLIMVQPTRDVVVMVEGVPLQTVQWDTAGGFRVHFKAWQISVPLIRSTQGGNSGIVHMS